MKDALLLITIATPAIIGLVRGMSIARARTVYDDVDAMRREREAQERAVRTGLYRPTGRVETSTRDAPHRLALLRPTVSDTLPWDVKVAGYCPMGCGRTLFLGDGGHVTCSYLPCPDPRRADDLLHNVNAPRAADTAGEQTNERTAH